jgi:hypothetical protein
MGEGLGGGGPIQCADDYVVDTGQIGRDIVVPEPQDPITLVLQERGPLDLLLWGRIMLPAVGFYD